MKYEKNDYCTFGEATSMRNMHRYRRLCASYSGTNEKYGLLGRCVICW